MQQLQHAFTIFLSLLVEALPFLLFGVVLSGLLLLFVDERKLIAVLPKHPFLGALAGCFIGFMFPVCECGNVPVARRLLMQGVSVPVAISFLLAAPTINPVVIWSTWTAFRDQPEIVILRVVFSLLIAVTLGLIFSVQENLKPFLQPAVVYTSSRVKHSFVSSAPLKQEDSGLALLQSGTFWLGDKTDGSEPSLTDVAALQARLERSPRQQPWIDRLPLFLETIIQELRELGAVLVLGSAIAALLQTYVPRETILSLGQGPIISIVVMMTLAATVSICSTVDSFFALSFASAFTSGSLLAFLVFGPMIDLKALGLMWSIFRTRAILYLFAIAAQLTFGLTLFVNLYVS
jgi:uncharacterized protein